MAAAVLSLAVTTSAWASTGLVRTVRCSSTGESARVVIDLSRPLDYDVVLSPDSTALVVEIARAVSESSLGEVKVGSSGIASVLTRTIKDTSDPARVEVTLRLDAPVAWKHFTLPASKGKPARIVVDVEPASATPSPAHASSPDSDATASDTFSTPSRTEPGPGRLFIVAVDAGHGGHDTGTMGLYGLMEKKLNLDIAQRVARDLNRREGIRAVLTRDDDYFLTLPERNMVAEKKKADIFVSIHINSAPSKSARGAEIYFVAPAGAERAANSEMSSGDAAHEFGLDSHDDADIVHMLLDVNQQSVLARSEALAANILEEVRDRNLMPTRNVKQKSFSVLRTISMPSVLVECGFVSNREDARLLKSEDGRERIAHAVAEGIGDFLRANPPQRNDAIASGSIVHRVQNGDTLGSISKRYNVTVNRICQLNGFRTSQQLRVGQEIVVQR
ncbi:MAG TPA: N-acetylmuramoyl-L-alanine amidase [Candidatus Krumholzibacteria bacterium]|nr:N-acetylmuramoyl-L-alanine amidase [Candidatus Krumholzibacteria bacterium]